MSKVGVIGSGFAGLAASCFLAKDGHEVILIDKHETPGGRCRSIEAEGFTFDMGPSWYWMPDVFERFFAQFGYHSSDFYKLERLNPSYQVIYQDGDIVKVPASYQELREVFESYEEGSAKQLDAFLKDAAYKYEVGMTDYVHKPSLRLSEFMDTRVLSSFMKIDLFKSISKEIRGRFKHPKLIQMLEFPVLFLGAKPADTPSFYSFMNYADFGLGTWHPKGGMYEVILGLKELAVSLGVEIQTNAAAEKIIVKDHTAQGIVVNGKEIKADIVLCGADYHHGERLLEKQYRQYSEHYWDKKIFAPSSLLFYVGFDKKLKNVDHHNLFFDTDFDAHAKDIYDIPNWPDEPLFYANFTSLTDPDTAPKGCENGFFLIPLAPGIEDTEELRETYFEKIITRFENLTDQSVKNNILFKESFCVKDFKKHYNSYKGNAYGMANTLMQTAFLRPKLKSKKVANLFFTGQLTVPGPGVPPALISGKLVSGLIASEFKTTAPQNTTTKAHES